MRCSHPTASVAAEASAAEWAAVSAPDADLVWGQVTEEASAGGFIAWEEGSVHHAPSTTLIPNTRRKPARRSIKGPFYFGSSSVLMAVREISACSALWDWDSMRKPWKQYARGASHPR